MATTSTEMNDLPVEMLLEILEKQPICIYVRELVAYCVEVCPQCNGSMGLQNTSWGQKDSRNLLMTMPCSKLQSKKKGGMRTSMNLI